MSYYNKSSQTDNQTNGKYNIKLSKEYDLNIVGEKQDIINYFQEFVKLIKQIININNIFKLYSLGDDIDNFTSETQINNFNTTDIIQFTIFKSYLLLALKNFCFINLKKYGLNNEYNVELTGLIAEGLKFDNYVLNENQKSFLNKLNENNDTTGIEYINILDFITYIDGVVNYLKTFITIIPVNKYIIQHLLIIIFDYLDSFIPHILNISAILNYDANKVNMQKIDDLILDKNKNNIITYLKINNFDHEYEGPGQQIWNQRFNIKLDKDKISEPSNKKHQEIYVEYLDDDNKYYEKKIDEKTEYVIKGKYTNPDSVITNGITKQGENGFLNVTKYDKQYLFGKFNNIFTPGNKNNQIKLGEVVEKANSGKPVFILGYGASGAGKTSSLVYFNKGAEGEKDGIIVQLCKELAGPDDIINLTIKEFYVEKELKIEDNKIIIKDEDINKDKIPPILKNDANKITLNNIGEKIYQESSYIGDYEIKFKKDNDKIQLHSVNNKDFKYHRNHNYRGDWIDMTPVYKLNINDNNDILNFIDKYITNPQYDIIDISNNFFSYLSLKKDELLINRDAINNEPIKIKEKEDEIEKIYNEIKNNESEIKNKEYEIKIKETEIEKKKLK